MKLLIFLSLILTQSAASANSYDLTSSEANLPLTSLSAYESTMDWEAINALNLEADVVWKNFKSCIDVTTDEEAVQKYLKHQRCSGDEKQELIKFKKNVITFLTSSHPTEVHFVPDLQPNPNIKIHDLLTQVMIEAISAYYPYNILHITKSILGLGPTRYISGPYVVDGGDIAYETTAMTITAFLGSFPIISYKANYLPNEIENGFKEADTQKIIASLTALKLFYVLGTTMKSNFCDSLGFDNQMSKTIIWGVANLSDNKFKVIPENLNVSNSSQRRSDYFGFITNSEWHPSIEDSVERMFRTYSLGSFDHIGVVNNSYDFYVGRNSPRPVLERIYDYRSNLN